MDFTNHLWHLEFQTQFPREAGGGRSMLDHRLKAILSGAKDQACAVLNDTKKTIFILTTGTQFDEFYLDHRVSASWTVARGGNSPAAPASGNRF